MNKSIIIASIAAIALLVALGANSSDMESYLERISQQNQSQYHMLIFKSIADHGTNKPPSLTILKEVAPKLLLLTHWTQTERVSRSLITVPETEDSSQLQEKPSPKTAPTQSLKLNSSKHWTSKLNTGLSDSQKTTIMQSSAALTTITCGSCTDNQKCHKLNIKQSSKTSELNNDQ